MELIKKEKDWFLSEEGGKLFASLNSLEERTIFIYSYLKTTVNKNFDKENTLFKIAFFFADTVYNSDKPYSKHPQMLNPKTNPFLQYLEKADDFYGNEKTYVIFTAILQEKVNTSNKNEWIYNSSLLKTNEFLAELSKKEIEYLPADSIDMIDPQSYKTAGNNDLLQLQIVWMFLK